MITQAGGAFVKLLCRLKNEECGRLLHNISRSSFYPVSELFHRDHHKIIFREPNLWTSPIETTDKGQKYTFVYLILVLSLLF